MVCTSFGIIFSLALLLILCVTFMLWWYVIARKDRANIMRGLFEPMQSASPIYQFQKTYIIALPDRKEYMDFLAKKLQLAPVQFTPLTMTDELDVDELVKDGKVELGRAMLKLKKSEIACYMSHLTALRQFLNDPADLQVALILEDDNQMPKDSQATRKTQEQLQNIDMADWDFVNLGRCYSKCIASNEPIVPLTSLCMNAYLVTRNGAQKILDASDPIAYPIDIVIKYVIDVRKGETNPAVLLQDRSIFGSTLGGPASSPPECANSLDDFVTDAIFYRSSSSLK